ncbi:G0/G1 switch protein 2 [Bos indicus]|uniref:G0/G1 switch 2 n=3 Tax=Bos TaxID=9903 RepID=G3N127_BOVIN|nr:G0/G1 switch protein 2 [Bos taurus]XP_005217392.1 G0/G1 switch protein 2 isoform X1 [Bos taurus]XP_027421507.1 G0/G1 switch protein 2 [Bos indicus x Bos taurus]XP_027421508.1 G0/G1 switch protein 2 [Bos indicus x Bos taurus]AFS34513.1 G0/G1 switch 2 protein [Bos taurus]AFS34514.1 G0/G1 switch 2 protein [Bos taurus]DAA21019.1 TPA: G0/G1switch 2-like [Bos taurus]
METVQELIPLAKELMAQKPSAKLVRMYVLGGVLALFGAVLGLMEAVCGPFAAAGRRREREATLAELRAARGESAPREQGKPLEAVQGCRALSNRLHAS